MLELLVDFNDIDEGVVSGLVEDVRGADGQPPAPGAGIVVLDDEGHRAWGTISRVGGGIVDVIVDWSTWSTDTPDPFESSSANRAPATRVRVRQPPTGTSTSGAKLRGTRRIAIGA